SVVFPHPDCNEEEAQRSVAAQLGLPHKLVTLRDAVGAEGLLLAALEISAHSPAPLMNVWTPAYRVLASDAAQEGCGAILTGARARCPPGSRPARSCEASSAPEPTRPQRRTPRTASTCARASCRSTTRSWRWRWRRFTRRVGSPAFPCRCPSGTPISSSSSIA